MATTLSDITLTNVLATTTAPYWTMKYDQKNLTPMKRAPLLAALRSRGRVKTTDTFKTGVNILNQTIQDLTESNSLEIVVAGESIQIPTYIEYNMVALMKKIVLSATQLKLVEKVYAGASRQDINAKERAAIMRRNVQKIKEEIMIRHFMVFFYNIEERIFGKAGSNFKGFTSFLNPTSGPVASVGTTSLDLTELDLKIDRPLWVSPATGSGDTGLGITLTGEAAIGYAEMCAWHSKILLTCQYRVDSPNLTVVSPAVYSRLSQMAENRIQYNAQFDTAMPKFSLSTSNGSTDKTIPLNFGNTAITLNGLPVLASPACTSNYVWLINTDDINIEVMQDEYSNQIYSGETAQKEAFVNIYTRRVATTEANWSDKALVVMRSIIQMSFNSFACLAVIEFDSTATD